MKLNRLTAWGMPAGAILALLMGWAPGRANAQGPTGAAANADQNTGKPYYTRDPVLTLPVKIDERARSTIQEFILWMKPAKGQWMKAQSIPPSQSQFKYQVPQDGEYGFSVMTVDRNRGPEPADVTKSPPELTVVVDTQPPTFELQPATLPGGQLALRCIVHDANPNYQALKISYRAPDGTIRLLEAVADRPGFFRVPGPYVLNGSVRVTAADRAGNQNTRDIDLKAMTARDSVVTPGQLAAQTQPIQQASATMPAGPAPGTPSSILPVPPEQTHTAAKTSPTAGLNLPTPAGAQPGHSAKEYSELQSHKPAAVPTSETRPGTPARQVINTKHASIEYRVDPVGPSGIGKVEVWMTADKGASWQRVGEDIDRRSPAELDLPGEGLFGIRLVVSNGNGFGGQPPAPNESPHTWIEVDTTPPTAQLRDVEPAAKDGKLAIRWTVTDKNLAAEPIHLYYSTKRDGPWQPIARGVKNDSLHLWAFPHDAGNQFFVRLEVADQAGNRTEVTTPMPVVLDMTEPHALVIGVTGVNATQH